MKNSPSFLMRYKWVIIVLILAIILGSLYAYNLYIEQSKLVMHGPENHPLNQERAEIIDEVNKCVRNFNKEHDFPEDTKPADHDFFRKIGLAAYCPMLSSGYKLWQLEEVLKGLYPPSSDSNYSD